MPPASNLTERFEAKVDRSGDHHVWTGSRLTDGTGQVRVQGKLTTAKRVAWELARGPLPPGAQVLSCPTEPACVRIEHLAIRETTVARSARGRRRTPGTGGKRQIRLGLWKLTVTAGHFADGSQRRVTKKVHVHGEVAAERALADFAAEIRDSRLPDEKTDRDVRIDEAIERFLAYLSEDKGREESTIEDYRGVHAKWGSPLIGRRKVRDVDDEHMDRVFGDMRAAGLSASRMATARNLYGPFFRWAKRRRIIRRSPMAEFEMPSSQHVAIERVPPEVDQLGPYLEAAVQMVPDIAPLLTLDAVTGLRAGELRGLRRSRLLAKSLKLNIDAASGRRGIKQTKTRRTREVSVDADTMAMLLRHCERMDERAADAGLTVADDAFVFSYEADCSKPMSRDYLTKRVAALKEHVGIATKRPETIALEDEALRLFRLPPEPRPGVRGPKPKGGLPFKEIGARLGRSGHWAEKAVASALRREQAPMVGPEDFFDGSIIALRKFTSSELLDAGFNIATVAQRQGHGPQVLARHYAKARRSSDRKAAEHLGQPVHGGQG